MKGNNFHHKVVIGQSLAPQSVTSATVSGNPIVEPQRTARQIAFILQGGALAASENGAFTLQGRLRSDGTTWETLKDKDGNNLILQGAVYDDAGALENGALLGTLRTDAYNTSTYEAVRIQFAESGGGAALIAVAHVLFDLRELPSGQTDQLFALQVGL